MAVAIPLLHRSCEALRLQKRWDDLRRQVGMYVNWPHDGLRHSYGTWHFALYQDLGKTAAQMGHSRCVPEMLKHSAWRERSVCLGRKGVPQEPMVALRA